MNKKEQRGFFGIGIYNPKFAENVGVIWRSANILGASFIFTVGQRYKKDPADTRNTIKHIPLFHYADFDDLLRHLPQPCTLVGVELHPKAHVLDHYTHPEQAVYLLGAEDLGLPEEMLQQCHQLVQLHGEGSFNVAVAASIVMYDRAVKATGKKISIKQ